MSRMVILAALCFALFAHSDAFFFDHVLDCQVSQWSAWSRTYGFGQRSRERKILRFPQNGGAACPTDLIDIQYTTSPLTVKQTAINFKNNFLQRTYKKNGRTVGQVRDLLIILDSSGSITSSKFTAAKTQLNRLLELLCPPGGNPFAGGYQQAALIRFASTPTEMFDFNDNSNTQQIQDAITNTAYTGGQTCTATAFDYARNNMFTTAKGVRFSPDVKQEVLILSDGESNCGGDAVAAARLLQNKAEVFALVTGTPDQAGKTEITEYVSSPAALHLFTLPGFTELEQLVNYLESASISCAPFDLS